MKARSVHLREFRVRSRQGVPVFQTQGKAQEALELINHAIEVAGPVPSFLDTRAVVLIRAASPTGP